MLTRWDPFTDFARLSNGFFSNDFHAPATSARASTFAPAVDVSEDAEAVTLTADVPGLTSEQVQVDIEKNVLTLRGERTFEKKEKKEGAGYQRIERTYGKFERAFVLPETVDGEKIEAKLEAGVLTVRIPKRPAAQPRRIAVKPA